MFCMLMYCLLVLGWVTLLSLFVWVGLIEVCLDWV